MRPWILQAHRHHRLGLNVRATLRTLLFMAALLPTRAWAQPSAPMSAGLARRLAEAADGARDGQQHWFIAEPRFPWDIHGIFPSRADAEARLPGFPTAGIFGPYLTPTDFGRPPLIMLGCIHLKNPIASTMHPLPNMYPGPVPALAVGPYCPERVIPDTGVIGLELLVRTGTDTIRIDLRQPGEADAVFLTAGSIQKFVLPYYTRLYGPAYARALWDSVTARVGRMP